MDAVDHVVLGAGAVGMAVAEALVRRGESVRVVNRSGLREPIAGVQSATGDITDPAFAASATHRARVIYQALNPAYHRWGQEFPGLQAAAIAAAQTAGARLVVMDNVYMYGRADGRPFTEDRAYAPTPARAASALRWPATSWPRTTPGVSGSPSGERRTSSGRAPASSR
jgi:nucleoside-diphosphate-sugar epimerase